MRVLVACECSGIIRDAFKAKGWYALSCDLKPTERPGQHYQGDVRDILEDNWDLLIAHPPCTHLAVSGARWFGKKKKFQEEALDFALLLLNAPIKRICIENPIGIISHIRKPTQIIQPWWFGYPETKATCLWLKGLLKLRPTKIVKPEYATKEDGTPFITGKGGKMSKTHYSTGSFNWLSEDRATTRSRTYEGIALAMADQWTSRHNKNQRPG